MLQDCILVELLSDYLLADTSIEVVVIVGAEDVSVAVLLVCPLRFISRIYSINI